MPSDDSFRSPVDETGARSTSDIDQRGFDHSCPHSEHSKSILTVSSVTVLLVIVPDIKPHSGQGVVGAIFLDYLSREITLPHLRSRSLNTEMGGAG